MRLGATEALALDSGARPLKAAETVPRAHAALKEKRYAQCRVPVPSRTMAPPPGAPRGAIRRPRRLGWRPRRSGARCERCEHGGRRRRGKMRAGLPGRRASSRTRPRAAWPAPRVQRPSWRWEALADGARARGRWPGPKVGSPHRAAANPCLVACHARCPSGPRAPGGLEERHGRAPGGPAGGVEDRARTRTHHPVSPETPFIRIYHPAGIYHPAATHQKQTSNHHFRAHPPHHLRHARTGALSAADTSHHAPGGLGHLTRTG